MNFHIGGMWYEVRGSIRKRVGVLKTQLRRDPRGQTPNEIDPGLRERTNCTGHLAKGYPTTGLHCDKASRFSPTSRLYIIDAA